MDIDPEEEAPSAAEADDPWLNPAWFDEPWLDETWIRGPWPPPWAPPSAVPPAVAGRRQKVVDELGRAILQLRLFRGWTQREVELGSGVDQTTISRIERGRQGGLSIQALAAILEALKVGRIQVLPPEGPPPTALELMLYGDTWKRAGAAADRRLARSRR